MFPLLGLHLFYGPWLWERPSSRLFSAVHFWDFLVLLLFTRFVAFLVSQFPLISDPKAVVVRPNDFADVSIPSWIRGGTLPAVIDDHVMA